MLKVHLHHSSKIISNKKSQKQYIKKGFLLFLLVMEGSGFGSVQIMTNPDPGDPKPYGYGYTTLLNGTENK